MQDSQKQLIEFSKDKGINFSSESVGVFYLLSGIYRYLNFRRRVQIFFLLASMLLSGLAEVFSLASVIPFLGVLTQPDKIWSIPIVKSLASNLNIYESNGLFLPFTILFIFAVLLSSGIRLANLWFSANLAALVGNDLSCQVLKKTLYQPYYIHIQRNSSSLISAITSQLNYTVSVINYTLQLCIGCIVSISIITGLIFLDKEIAIASIFLFGFSYFLIAGKSRKKLKKNSQIISSVVESQTKIVQESLGSIRDISLDGTHDFYLSNYNKIDKQLRQKQADNQFLGAYPRFALEAIGMVSIAIMAYLISKQNNTDLEIIPLLGTLALGAQRLLPSLQLIYYSWSGIRGYEATILNVLKLLEQSIPDNYKSKVKPLEFNKLISFDNVSYRYYQSNNELVLSNVSFSIHKGERIGVVGSTGSGKSTFLDLFMGLLKPTFGNIYIDGKDLYNTSDPDLLLKWKSSIAHVPQSIFLADKTFAENIAFGIPLDEIDIDRVVLAARKAQISNFIEKRQSGYFGYVGERGVQISGGQRQRIGIARAIYKNAKVLVLDEATSALDNKTEDAVMHSLDIYSKDLTVLIIAHRLTTVKNCDRIIEVKDGTINEKLRPDKLSKT